MAEITIETTSAGPAFWDAAVPVSTKIPVPMIDPMPSAVRFHGPSDRRSSPRSASCCRSWNDFFGEDSHVLRSWMTLASA